MHALDSFTSVIEFADSDSGTESYSSICTCFFTEMTITILLFFFQGVHYPSAPRRNIPRRVDLYYSSWRIQAGD